MKLSPSISALALAALAVGCAAPAEEDAPSIAEAVASGAQAVPVSSTPAAAVIGEWEEIYRGDLNIVNQLTYNNPSGSLIRVKVTGCQLASLAVSAMDSNLAVTLLPAPAGIGPDGAGGYTGLWRLPYASNLGTITVTATAYGGHQSCHAVVEQSTAVDTPPPPPSACGTLNEPQCRSNISCQAIYQQSSVWAGAGYVLQSRFLGCVSR